MDTKGKENIKTTEVEADGRSSLCSILGIRVIVGGLYDQEHRNSILSPKLLAWKEAELSTFAEVDIPGAHIATVYQPKAAEAEISNCYT